MSELACLPYWSYGGTDKTRINPGVQLLNITTDLSFSSPLILFWLLTDVKTLNPVDSFQCSIPMELIINVMILPLGW